MSTEHEQVLRAFASAAVIAGARLAQHDGMAAGPFDSTPDEPWHVWMERVGKLLVPLGHDGALIAFALTHIAEGAGDWLMYETAAGINEALGKVIRSSSGAPLAGGVVEYGDNEQSCYPGAGDDADATALRSLLDVTQRWHLADSEEHPE